MSLIDSMHHMEQSCPELRDRYLTLAPFNDVIHTTFAGTDKDTGEQWFGLDFSVWRDGECILPQQFKVYENRVVYEDCDDEHETDMWHLWEYLRQLPRDPWHFTQTAHKKIR